MQIVSLLQTYKTRYPVEAEKAEQFLGFAGEGSNWFCRSRLDGHFTGSAWVVSQCGKRTLLTHHKKLNRWLQLGGHADGNPDLVDVALREAYEESGLKQLEVAGDIFDIDVHPIPARKDEPEHLHWDVRFVVTNLGSETFDISDESNDLAWIDITTIPNNPLYDDSVQRMAKKWLARA